MSTQKEHFHMYKKGKLWLVAGITTSVLAFGAWHDQLAQAATTTSTDENQPQTSTVTVSTTEKAVTLRQEAAPNKVVTPESPAEPTINTPKTDTNTITVSGSNNQGSQSASKNETTVPTGNAVDKKAVTTPKPTEVPTTDTTNATTTAATPQPVNDTPTAPQNTVIRPAAVQSRATVRVDENINDWMPNQTLQQMVLSNLNRSDAGKTWASVNDITKQDLLFLKKLDASGFSTYIDGKTSFSLTGLEYATNITDLNLLNDLNTPNVHWQADITDITPLAALTNLTRLQLIGQRVSDITPLANLKQLVDLNLANNQISDFSSLNAAQYTKYFYYSGQLIYQDVVRVPTTGQYSLTNPVKPPKGVTLNLQTTGSLSRIVFDVPGNDKNPTARLYYSGASNTLTGDQINYQVTYNQIMPGPTVSPYPNMFSVIQNPYTYYLVSALKDSAGNEIADIFTPYIIVNYAKDVTVKYVDTDNKPLAEDTILSGLEGDAYQAPVKSIAGYHLRNTPENATGTFSDTAQTVTFVYDMTTSTVTVHYQDKAGNTIQADTQTTAQVGTDYQFEAPTLLGYKYSSTTGNATGTYTEDPIEITFIYDEVNSTVTTHYQDTTGKTIQADTQTTGRVGTNYQTKAPTILGYNYHSTTSNATGTYTEDPIDVTFIYDIATANVTVQYQDENGQTLQPNDVHTGQVGTDYTLTAPKIAGHTYQSTVGSASGQYAENNATVIFIYRKDAVTPPVTPATTGRVIVTHVDEDGIQIAPATVLTGQVGTAYRTQALNDSDTYRLKKAPTNASGTFDKDDVQVIYVYETITTDDDKINPGQPDPETPTKPTTTVPGTDNQSQGDLIHLTAPQPVEKLVPVSTSKSATLPKTNERRGSSLLGFALFGSLIAWAGAIHRRKN
ncbi:MucBP domain-containing protein [Lactiplantibacillus daoliensis]|uniref:MucBP domain-containing protein n=1 Tax=Lactiplantibacillus daoliensis TaxID=2559916 RepID=A0ABW1UI54_9LACO|nr:MucBP domain-containing protein [Lactiplantibacillus daoliensis]